MQNGILTRLGIMSLLAATAYGQGSFQNLDFELANIQPGQPPGPISDADAIPGWIAYIGTQPSAVYYDLPSAGSASVVLFGTPWSIEGAFSVQLQGGLGPDLSAVDASIRQTGQVPLGAQSILFKAQPGIAPLSVSLGGHGIPISALGSRPNYTVYGGDVSAFAGQTLELQLAALPSNNYWGLDSIEFSTSAIPEPSTLSLLALGSLLTAWRSAIRRKVRRAAKLCIRTVPF